MKNHARRKFRGFQRPKLSVINSLVFSAAFVVLVSISRIPNLSSECYEDVFFSWPVSPLGKKLGTPDMQRATIHFVLFLGLEGTGHHFWQDLIKSSPLHARLTELGLHPAFTKRLTRTLYRHKAREKALWSAPCQWQSSDPKPNTTEIQINLIETLSATKDHIAEQHIAPRVGANTILFPVNLLATGNDFGVASYPSFLKPCRALQYPNLDLWYQACDSADVLCSHVYLFRDPVSIIRSTTDNRPINKDKLEAIHLYSTLLQVLHSQIIAFPTRLLACLDYDFATRQQHMKNQLASLLGFENEQLFDDIFNKVFKHKASLTEQDRHTIIPPEIQVFMESLVRIHDMVQQTCYMITEKNAILGPPC